MTEISDPGVPDPVAPVLNETQSTHVDTLNPKEGNQVANSAAHQNAMERTPCALVAGRMRSITCRS